MNKTISAVRNWLRLSPAGREQSPAPVPILLASGRDDDYQTLQSFLHGTKWRVERALSWNEVPSLCECHLNPVVLVDRYFQGADWQSTVASLLDPAARRCVILLSDVSDPYLWNELVQQGGFDVLARPFECPEVLRILAFAQRHSTGNWPSLHVPRQHLRLAGRSK
jgi:FixJ family two-component response regulator